MILIDEEQHKWIVKIIKASSLQLIYEPSKKQEVCVKRKSLA